MEKAEDDATAGSVKRIEAPTGNYYGSQDRQCGKQNGIRLILHAGTESYDGYDSHPISKEFFEAWVKEFGPPPPRR